MQGNLEGAYNAKHPADHENAGEYCTNSGTCVIACCYINALGKVLLKGGPARAKDVRRDFERFEAFVEQCMPDFVTESAGLTFPPTAGGRRTGLDWLYEEYRCGFVHAFASPNVAWGPYPDMRKYWRRTSPRVVLNIDELVRGYRRGVNEFCKLPAADPELRSRFKDFVSA